MIWRDLGWQCPKLGCEVREAAVVIAGTELLAQDIQLFMAANAFAASRRKREAPIHLALVFHN